MAIRSKDKFQKSKNGDIMNCFGLAKIISIPKNETLSNSNNQNDYKVGDYLFGNTGTQGYFYLDPQDRRQVFQISTQLVKMYGQSQFLYLINNGLAAYSGFEIMNPKQNQKVLVSTAAGATSLLLCQLLKLYKSQIIAITSSKKVQFMQKYTKAQNIINYENFKQMDDKLSKIKFNYYFDNVGQNILDLVLKCIGQNGVIALCGAISNYNDHKKGGILNYDFIRLKTLTLEGINFSNLIPRAFQIFPLFKKKANLYLTQIKPEQFQDYFNMLLNKSNKIIGKIIVKFKVCNKLNKGNE